MAMRARVTKAVGTRLYAHWRRQPVLEGQVLYESFGGAGLLCNPAAVYRQLRSTAGLTHLWVDRTGRIPGHVPSVPYRSREYFAALARSQFLVNNVTFPALFDKRADQVYLNTWHGTPLKRMGRDSGATAADIANTVRNFEQADILLSTGPFMTQTMYESGYGISAGVVRLGSPRIDEQFAVESSGGAKIVLYAPTWRQATATEPADDTAELLSVMRALRSGLPDDYRPLLRVHEKVEQYLTEDFAEFLAPADLSINALLGRTDTLITDYSSVFFDFLATGSRVVFFWPDDYPRGLYLSPAELPGPVVHSLPELGAAVTSDIDAGDFGRRYGPDEDGHAGLRVAQALLARA